MFGYGQKSIRRRVSAGRLDGGGEPGEREITPLLRRIFENRGIGHVSELSHALSGLRRPDSLKDGELATALVCDAIKTDKRVLIIGDYDTDGASAVAVALSGLKSMGLGKVDYLVPNRFRHGYGLSPEIAEIALRKSPDLVITVDNGISSVQGTALLKSNGVTVIITDHHLPAGRMPAADAILNPNQPGCEFPSKVMAGVGVMFYLLLLVRAKLKATGWFAEASLAVPNLGDLVDLVALGTVSDMAPLDHNNRILVTNGVLKIRGGKCRPGILALLTAGGRNPGDVMASDFGFVIAPRLNAAGRLDDISTGIECLLAVGDDVAREYAAQLDRMNRQRKEIQQDMQNRAMEIVSSLLAKQNGIGQCGDEAPAGLCLYEAGWHQGIIGLVASRIKEKTNQPAIAFAQTPSGDLTGSARSVAGLHIKDLLESIATENSGLVEKFGGHAMAAGLTIRASGYDRFRERFHEKIAAHYARAGISNTIDTDGELQPEEISLANAELIRQIIPWGQGFPAPRFDGEFIVLDCRVVGQAHLRMTLQPVDQAIELEAIAFRALEPGRTMPELERVRAVYQLEVNHFRGKKSLQLVIEYLEPVEPERSAD